jgi:hypothetical protein
MQYVTVMRESHKVWGPFDQLDDAQRFASFMTEEVDPCDVEPLCSPHRELLTWRDQVPGRLADPWGDGGSLTAEQCSPSKPSEGVRIMRGGKVLSRIWARDAFRLARDLIAAAISTEEEPPFLWPPQR